MLSCKKNWEGFRFWLRYSIFLQKKCSFEKFETMIKINFRNFSFLSSPAKKQHCTSSRWQRGKWLTVNIHKLELHLEPFTFWFLTHRDWSLLVIYVKMKVSGQLISKWKCMSVIMLFELFRNMIFSKDSYQIMHRVKYEFYLS